MQPTEAIKKREWKRREKSRTHRLLYIKNLPQRSESKILLTL